MHILKCIKRPYPFQNLLGLAGLDTLLVNGLDGDASNVLSLFLAGGALIFLALYVTLSARARALPHFSGLRLFVTLYCLLTGVFFFVLVTQLNKVVILLAGLHNLIEWGILSQLLAPKRPRTGVATGVAFVWFVWLVVMLIPDTLIAFLAEEVVGIWPDFILLITSWLCWRTCNQTPMNSDDKRRYRIATQNWAIGATFHMIQIFTLLLQGISFISPTTAMIMTYLSALPNYYYYVEFALYFDGDHSDPPFPLPFSNRAEIADKDKETFSLSFAFDFDDFNWIRGLTVAQDRAPEANLERHRSEDPGGIKKLLPLFWVFGCSLALAAAVILGPFLAGGMCPHVGPPCVDHSGNVWQISLYGLPEGGSATSTQQLLEQTLFEKHSARGNLYHSVFVGQGDNEGRFLEVEKWSNQLDLDEANQKSSLRSSTLVRRVADWAPLSQVEARFGEDPWMHRCDGMIPFYPDPKHDALGNDKALNATRTTVDSKKRVCLREGVTGMTVADLQRGQEEFALNALSRGLISRKEAGNRFYFVFKGATNVLAPKGPQRESMIEVLAVLEQWGSIEQLATHMQTDTVRFIQAAAAATTSSGGVLLSSPFSELFVCQD